MKFTKTAMRIIIALALVLVLGTTSVVSAGAVSQSVYCNSGAYAINTYNRSSNNNGTIAHENNINKNNANIIVIGDSRTCQLLNLDYKMKKYRLSGYAAWGQTYNGGINNKSKKVISGLTADAYIKTKLIQPALSSSKPCHIWVFGTINETASDASAKKIIAYVKELRQYCINTRANKKVTIHVVGTVGGSSQWTTANKKVSTYNQSIQNAFGKGKENKSNVTIVTANYSSIVRGTSPLCSKKYYIGTPVFGYTYTKNVNAQTYTKDGKHGTVVKKVNNNNYGYDNGLHYTTNTLEVMGNWLINNSK